MIPVADVLFFDVVVFFHVLAVVIGIGPTFAYSAFFAVAGKDGGRAVPAVSKAVVTWDTMVTLPASALIVATGLYMVGESGWAFSDFFVSWGFVAIVVMVGVSHAILLPNLRKSVEVAERDIAASPGPEVQFSDEYNGHVKKISTFGPILGIITILTIYMMTAKPFL